MSTKQRQYLCVDLNNADKNEKPKFSKSSVKGTVK